MRKYKGEWITFLGGVLWGLSGTVGQYLMKNLALPAFPLTQLRLLVAGTCLVLYALFRSGPDFLKIFRNKRDLRDLLFFGFCGVGASQVAYLVAISYSDAGTATVLQYLGPIFVVLIMCILERRLPKLLEITCLVLAFGGTFILVTGGNLNALVISKEAFFWGILAAGALVVYNIAPRELLRKYSTEAVTGMGMLVMGVVLNVAKPIEDYRIFLGEKMLPGVVVVVFVGTLLAYVLYLKGVALIGPVKASLISCVEPVAAVLFPAIFLGTPVTISGILGMCLILGAVVLLTLQREK